LTFGKHTITGLLSASGKQFQDWSAAYRLFKENRIDQRKLFTPVITGILDALEQDDPLVTMMDDTLVRKCGRKIAGTGWKRDPLGPAFHTNLIWGQRYLQISAALPDSNTPGRACGIPIDFHHAPSPAKPRKNAPPEAWEEYKVQQKTCKISAFGATQLAELRRKVPDRKIVCTLDGGYTNKELFVNIPENTTIIGRIRKDASLFLPPDEPIGTSRGRKKYYGEPLPTPEQLRQDDSIPWRSVTAFAVGKHHEFKVKTMAPVRWKSSKDKDMLIVVIRPLGYRPRKGAKLLYRNPSYLICSDPDMPIEQLLQAYLWRWEIELNFRDEKTIMGVGEAQVRTPSSVQTLPAFIVAIYAILLLAAHSIKATPSCLPPPKWYPKQLSGRITTQKAISLFRSKFWGINIDSNKSGFASKSSTERTPFYSLSSIKSAVCYALK